jgi:hypothetical protein
MPELRQREHALQTELRAILDPVNDRAVYLRLAETLSAFLAKLRSSADTLDIQERQRIVRLIVKEILIEDESIIVRHSIPVSQPPNDNDPKSPSARSRDPGDQSYLLRSGRPVAPLEQPHARRSRQGIDPSGSPLLPVRGRLQHLRSQPPRRRTGDGLGKPVPEFLTTKLRLKVNETKSAVAQPEERKFLGFSISNDGGERRIAPKALDIFKERIREMTGRTRGLGLSQIVEELTPYLVGWGGYFGFCQTPRVLTNLEAWIRRRLRSYLWRQWGNGHNRFKELRRRGLSQFRAAVAAGSPTGFWRISGHPAVQSALRNHYFDSIGLPRLYIPTPA